MRRKTESHRTHRRQPPDSAAQQGAGLPKQGQREKPQTNRIYTSFRHKKNTTPPRRCRPFTTLQSIKRETTKKSIAQAMLLPTKKGGRWESNPRHPEPQSGALTTELHPPFQKRCKGNCFFRILQTFSRIFHKFILHKLSANNIRPPIRSRLQTNTRE